MSDSPHLPLGPGSTRARHQLDELEALMERMLALPVLPSAEVPLPVAPIGSPPVAAPEPGAMALPMPAAEVPGPPAPAPRLPAPTVLPEKAPAVVRRLPRPPGLGWARPLLLINHRFDRAVLWLGPPGRWLRGPTGRMVLGLLGLLFLVAAIAWSCLAASGWIGP